MWSDYPCPKARWWQRAAIGLACLLLPFALVAEALRQLADLIGAVQEGPKDWAYGHARRANNRYCDRVGRPWQHKEGS